MSREIRRNLCISATSTALLRPETRWRKCCPWDPPGRGGRPWRRWQVRGRWAPRPSGSISSPWRPGWRKRTERLEWLWAGQRQRQTRTQCVSKQSGIGRSSQVRNQYNISTHFNPYLSGQNLTNGALTVGNFSQILLLIQLFLVKTFYW